MRKLFDIRFVTCGIVGLLTLAIMFQGAALMAEEGDAIAIAKVEHDGPVDFEKEILPIFRRNCLACHNATDAESDLVLETPQTISKGGAEGPVVVAGKPGMSSLLLLASRQQESYMPPDDNDVGAKKLTSRELGLINLWILEGAKGTVVGNQGPSWQPLPFHPMGSMRRPVARTRSLSITCRPSEKLAGCPMPRSPSREFTSNREWPSWTWFSH